MTIQVNRDRTGKMKHIVSVRQHMLVVDEPQVNGGEDLGPTAHDLYDSALGTCKAMTVLWYATRKKRGSGSNGTETAVKRFRYMNAAHGAVLE
jgi:putative redox protein